ncbi:MAG: PEP-CTERM sorting domain-containing protein [Planctomycetota bacterium]|jgi:hypothetical protein
MKNSRIIILSCVISIVIASAASAAWEAVTDPVSLGSLEGVSLIVGDKEFSGFDLNVNVVDGGALLPDPYTMTVLGVRDIDTGDYGLRFNNFPWSVGSGQIISVTLSFKASILPLPIYDDYYIKDVWLSLTGAGATGTGVVSASENVWDAFPGGTTVASLSCSKQDGDGGANLSDYAEFAPLKEIWIQSKSISVTGGTSGTASFDEFFQFYSQIPEPATLVILGMGGVWIFNRRKRTV